MPSVIRIRAPRTGQSEWTTRSRFPTECEPAPQRPAARKDLPQSCPAPHRVANLSAARRTSFRARLVRTQRSLHPSYTACLHTWAAEPNRTSGTQVRLRAHSTAAPGSRDREQARERIRRTSAAYCKHHALEGNRTNHTWLRILRLLESPALQRRLVVHYCSPLKPRGPVSSTSTFSSNTAVDHRYIAAYLGIAGQGCADGNEHCRVEEIEEEAPRTDEPRR